MRKIRLHTHWRYFLLAILLLGLALICCMEAGPEGGTEEEGETEEPVAMCTTAVSVQANGVGASDFQTAVLSPAETSASVSENMGEDEAQMVVKNTPAGPGIVFSGKNDARGFDSFIRCDWVESDYREYFMTHTETELNESGPPLVPGGLVFLAEFGCDNCPGVAATTDLTAGVQVVFLTEPGCECYYQLRLNSYQTFPGQERTVIGGITREAKGPSPCSSGDDCPVAFPICNGFFCGSGRLGSFCSDDSGCLGPGFVCVESRCAPAEGLGDQCGIDDDCMEAWVCVGGVCDV